MRYSRNFSFSIPQLLLTLVTVSSFQTSRYFAAPSTTTTRLPPLFVSSTASSSTQPTELPDSLVDAAERAAESCAAFVEAAGPMARCRVDFDTSAGDETFPILKTSTEFMQNLVRFLSYRLVPGLQAMKQAEVQRVAEARVALQQILQRQQEAGEEINEEEKQYYINILESNGKDPEQVGQSWQGPIVRVYFPDEGNAALARRDWTTAAADLPPCVQFSSCGGIQMQDISRDTLVFFFCPKASESDYVEDLLRKTESDAPNLQLTVFVNPNLVDMGVTGFGMAGRMLRERLLDGLTGTYYLRTLAWGALTRSWPSAYSIWQEDENSEGGYKLIRTLGYLPSNPEVEDIYDAENGGGRRSGDGSGGGPLDQLGDFVNGMMRL
jgi:Domain of unknown function (DUF1995)